MKKIEPTMIQKAFKKYGICSLKNAHIVDSICYYAEAFYNCL